MSWAIIPEFRLPDEPEALSYIAAVEAADGQELEPAVKLAYNTFIKGCKADGTWNAIKASCILAGARTLNGALVPLAGTAPTNYNFVSGDYDRETGLVGDGSTKYLDSNRSSANEILNNSHLSSFCSTQATVGGSYIGVFNAPTTTVSLIGLAVTLASRFYLQTTTQLILTIPQNSTLLGISRSKAGQTTTILNNQIATQAITSTGTTPLNYFIFAFNNNGSPGFYTNPRLAFYSIGESLDLAKLDARVTDLMSDLAAAIV